MRVLYLTHRLPYAPNRGDRIRSYHTLRVLAEHADVHLVSLVADAEEENKAHHLAGAAASIRTVRRSPMRNAARAIAALPFARPLTHVLLDGPAMGRALADAVHRERPDVVLAYCSGMARFAFEPPLADIPVVVDMVDVDSAKWRELATITRPPRAWIYAREARRLRAFEAHAARRAVATTFVNERERAILARRAPANRMHVVPNGIDVDAFRPLGSPAESARVVFCGVMDYAPNATAAIWLATEVWPRVTACRPDALLTLVGANPSRRVRSLANRDRTIEVTGRVPDVRPFLWRSAVAAAPLSLARGVQNKVLEAVAAGLPTVVTPAVFDGLPAEVTSACIPAATPEEFASAILAVLSRTPAERRAVATRANVRALAWRSRLSPLIALLHPDQWSRRGRVS